jgi:hypothetical protein
VTQGSRGNRQGVNFSVRLSPAERAELVELCAHDHGPRNLGPYLVWCAKQRASEAHAALPRRRALPELTALPTPAGTASSSRALPARVALPPPKHARIILDLCAGSGSWSQHYEADGYDVRRVTWPERDVRTYQIPKGVVWGVLAAPPCTEFSLAKNGHEHGLTRDFVEGMACVNACVRIVQQARPQWWALENPVGLLSRWLGRPSLVFEPYEFGDPWSKATALWGSFAPPVKGPHVQPIDGGGPLCTLCFPNDPRTCNSADHRAITPGGFARAFYEANP